jgi:hypothetical protein
MSDSIERVDLEREGSKYGMDEFLEIQYLCLSV